MLSALTAASVFAVIGVLAGAVTLAALFALIFSRRVARRMFLAAALTAALSLAGCAASLGGYANGNEVRQALASVRESHRLHFDLSTLANDNYFSAVRLGHHTAAGLCFHDVPFVERFGYPCPIIHSPDLGPPTHPAANFLAAIAIHGPELHYTDSRSRPTAFNVPAPPTTPSWLSRRTTRRPALRQLATASNALNLTYLQRIQINQELGRVLELRLAALISALTTAAPGSPEANRALHQDPIFPTDFQPYPGSDGPQP